MVINKIHIKYKGVDYYKRTKSPYLWYYFDSNTSSFHWLPVEKRIEELEMYQRILKIEKLKSNL